MQDFFASRTPHCLAGIRVAVVVCLFALVEIGAYFEPSSELYFVSAIGLLVLPVVISVWACLGRGPIVLRWCCGLAACAVLWMLKLKQWGLTWPDAVVLAGCILEHFLLFPLALSWGQPIKNRGKPPPTFQESFRFGLRDMLYLVTAVAVVCAVFRALGPFPSSGSELRDAPSTLMLLGAILFYLLCQVPTMLIVMGGIWETRESWLYGSNVWIAIAGVGTVVLTCVAAITGMAFVVLLELMLIVPALLMTRRKEA